MQTRHQNHHNNDISGLMFAIQYFLAHGSIKHNTVAENTTPNCQYPSLCSLYSLKKQKSVKQCSKAEVHVVQPQRTGDAVFDISVLMFLCVCVCCDCHQT